MALQDNSDDVAARYGWLGAIAALSVATDTTFDVYSNVQVLTQTGHDILTSPSGLQIGYANMATFGLVSSEPSASRDATGGRTPQVVLITATGDPSNPNLATVSTDKEDYFPPDTVFITGAGWDAGETVNLVFHEEPLIHPDGGYSVVADGAGHLANQTFVIDSSHIGVRFTLTATGQSSGKTAQATFTDATKTVQASTTVSPIAASITAILYNTSGTCTTAGGGQTSLGSFNLTSAVTTIAAATNTNGKSVKLTAGATSTTPSGSAFLNWASPTGGAFTVVSGEPLAICVPGTNGNQTDTFQPVYVTTSTSVVSSANPSVFGQSVTFIATVTSLIGGTVNAGTVSFKDGATTLSSPSVNASGVGNVRHGGPQCHRQPALDHRGLQRQRQLHHQHVIGALAGGERRLDHDDDHVRHARSFDRRPGRHGQLCRGPGRAGGGDRHGNVTVTDGVDSCTGTVTAGTCSISLTTLGARTLTASYIATTNFNGSTSGGTPHQVNQAPSTTTLTSSANPSVFGQTVVLTATVKNGATAITVGNIAFIEGGTCASPTTVLQANQTPSATGVVTYTTAAFSVAAHGVIACYDGSAGFAQPGHAHPDGEQGRHDHHDQLRHARPLERGPGGDGQLRGGRDPAWRWHAYR